MGKRPRFKKVKVIPDGSGRFTRGMGMLVRKDPFRTLDIVLGDMQLY